MHSTKLIKLTISGIGLVAMLFGCSSTSDNTGTGGSGTGGTSTGGTTGTGGTGTGGTPATGGTPGTGGIVSTGGSPGTGGIVSTGGTAGGGGGHAGGGTSGGGGHGGGSAGATGTGGTNSGGGSSGSMTLTSPHLTDGAHFSSMYTCAESPPLSGKTTGNIGNGINPELDWTNPPAGTMSFAMTFLDTTLIDMGGSMVQFGEHWAIWNIPSSATTMMEGLTGTLSGDLMGAKQTGTFLAPCATSMNGTMGDKYEFTLYALSTSTLAGLSGNSASVDQVRKALAALPASTILGTAVLTGYAGKGGQ